jgi:protein involved in polysaccharide export with SLBB domain
MKSTLPLLALLLSACVTTGPLPPPVPATVESGTAGALGAGDVVEIRVAQEEEMSGEYRVDPDGMVGFPYLGAVRADGRTPRELADVVGAQLVDRRVLVEPVVTVRVVEANSRVIYVLGHVKMPGDYPYYDGMGVIDAISAAGGIVETGLPNRTTLTRVVDGAEVSSLVKVGRIVEGRAPDTRLSVGDIVFVPESPI